MEGTQLEHVAQLAGRSRAAVEPDDSGDIFELIFGDVLLAIEEEGQSGVAFLDGEVARHGNSAVVVGGPGFVKIELVADGGELEVVIGELSQFVVGDVETFLEPVFGGLQHGEGEGQDETYEKEVLHCHVVMIRYMIKFR